MQQQHMESHTINLYKVVPHTENYIAKWSIGQWPRSRRQRILYPANGPMVNTPVIV